MDNLMEFLNNGKAHVKVEMNADDLMAFSENLIQRAKDELGSMVEEAKKERMLTKTEVKEIFGVCEATIWHWNNKGILKLVKTGNMVVIPISDDKLETLLKKYDYCMPSITDQTFNRTIKEVGEKLSKRFPSLAKNERTLLKKQEKDAEKRNQVSFKRDAYGNVLKPRWQLISTHTARRSGITNMYLSGKYPVQQMRSVSGHKDRRTFLDYVKLSMDELAEVVAKSSCDGMF